MRGSVAVLLLAGFLGALAGGAARAEGERAGVFDYYVMALSWSPSFCALEGTARGDPQCAGAGRGFVLHGLWPQFEAGWPSYCPSGTRNPSRAETAAMADIMGSGGLAWYQWKKHGRCSGLAPEDYFAAARRAFAGITLPPALAALRADVRLPASVVEAAFLEVNPGLEAAMITITCKAGMIQEARICLTRDLTPRACAADVARDCTLGDALLPVLP